MALKDWSMKITTVRFAAAFICSTVLFGVIGLIWDLGVQDGYYWFQRSGALLSLAGLEAQHVKLMSSPDAGMQGTVGWPDVLGMTLIVVGTVIWGFGDLFVKLVLGQA